MNLQERFARIEAKLDRLDDKLDKISEDRAVLKEKVSKLEGVQEQNKKFIVGTFMTALGALISSVAKFILQGVN